ncbi:MAG: restriction endonuclease subunit S, partial [Akkermansiaceae bacterium]
MSEITNCARFGDVAEFRNGMNFSRESQGRGCLLIGIPDFKDNFKPNYETLSEINPTGVVHADDYLKKGDILFVRSNGNKALVGRSLFITKAIKAVFSGFCIRARVTDAKIDPEFCAYYTRTAHFKKSISSSAGTNINNLNQRILGDVRLPPFDLPTQQKIAAVLSALDAKIELNNRINAELEGMAKLLYDYWFVQFDFPITAAQAAAMGKPQLEGQPYQSSGAPMTQNKTLKRDIPEGWAASFVEDLLA